MSRRLRAFKRWMKANGIEYSNALDLCIGHGSVSGVGVKALCDLKEGDLIATIPKKACLTIKTSAAGHTIEEANLEGALGLSVALMYERSKGEKSPWYDYLDLLPHRECVPLVWSLDEVDTLLAGTELHEVVKEDMQLLCEEWEESIVPLTALYPVEYPREWFSIEQYFAAKTVVGSRAFEVDDYHGFSMVPLADLFNHKTAAEDVHITSVANDVDSDIDNNQESLVDDNNTNCFSSDISDNLSTKEGGTNFAESLNGHGRNEIIGAGFSTSSGSSKEVLEMILIKDVEEGNEVFNTYGTLSNAALLHRYGFTEPDNPFDIVNVDFDLVIDTCLLSFSSRHIRACVTLWRRLGCAGCSSQDCEYFEISASGNPQLELLMLLYIIHLSEEAYQSLDYAAPQHGQSLVDVAKVLYSVGCGIKVATSHHKDRNAIPKLCVGSNRTNLENNNIIMKMKTGENGEITNSDEWLLTSSVSQCLLLLADKRDTLYGTSSLEEDLQLLKSCVSTEQPKLFHAMSLRVSERSILNRLKLYASKATKVKTHICNSYRKRRKL
eukprot:Gb_03288 [translate_table: standard]